MQALLKKILDIIIYYDDGKLQAKDLLVGLVFFTKGGRHINKKLLSVILKCHKELC